MCAARVSVRSYESKVGLGWIVGNLTTSPYCIKMLFWDGPEVRYESYIYMSILIIFLLVLRLALSKV